MSVFDTDRPAAPAFAPRWGRFSTERCRVTAFNLQFMSLAGHNRRIIADHRACLRFLPVTESVVLPPERTNTMTEQPRRDSIKGTFSPQAFLSRAEAGKTIEKYGKNQEIFTQGAAADSVFYIQKGKVKITVLSEHGKEAVVGILTQGQFFGEACLDGAPLRTATSHAMEDCLITSITKPAMLAALDAQPKFSAFFVSYLLSRNSRIEDDLIDQLFNSSERRLARLLLLLANFGKEGGGAPAAVTLSQETLAEMIGTTRSRVSFFMNKFRKKGFISYNGKIEVHSSLLDAVLRDKPQIKEDD
jgi:CRP/FNR family cyclic AMP-dependent transcriptional regulator